MEGKKCTKCKEVKPRDQFGNEKKQKDGLSYTCKACKSVYNKENSHYHRKYSLMRFYKLTIEDYLQMFEAQSGLCAVCRQPESRTTKDGAVIPLAVDHDHSCCPGPKSCGECVRALLCFSCNTALGKAVDSAKRLRDMANYLESFPGYVDRLDNDDVTF